MAKYRPIHTSFWDDDYILELDPDEKLLFLYLISNNYTSLCGIYTLSIGYTQMATGIDKQRILEILDKFTKDKKAIFHNGWVYVVNVRKHQTTSPKIQTGIEREEAAIPREVLINLKQREAEAKTGYPIHTLSIPMDKPILKPILKLKPIPNGNTSSPPARSAPPKRRVIEYSEQYESFYQAFPRKVDKLDGWMAWQRLTLEEQSKAMGGVVAFSKSVEGQEARYIKHPATWLNGRCWESDYSTDKGSGGLTAEEKEMGMVMYNGVKIYGSLTKQQYENLRRQGKV